MSLNPSTSQMGHDTMQVQQPVSSKDASSRLQLTSRWMGMYVGSWCCLFIAMIFPFPTYWLFTRVESDPVAVIVNGLPLPQFWMNACAGAFLTTLCLDIFAWTWTIEPSRASMFAFPLTIGACSTVCYVALACGYAPILQSFDGRRFIPSRYLKWMFTTPLMLLTYASLCEISLEEVVFTLFSNFLMIIFGAMASYCIVPHNFVYLGLSFLFYIPVIYYINKMLVLAINSYSLEEDAKRRALNSARIAMLCGWIAMPVLWVLAALQAIDVTTEEIGYELVDFLTKCGCSSMIMHSSLQTQADREAERSRQALIEERQSMIGVLQETTKQREKFFAALSLQLRSPLECMAGVVEGLMNDPNPPSTAEQTSQLNAFVTAGTHLVNTIEDMLELSQKKQQEREAPMPITLWEVDVREIVDEIIQLIRGLMKTALAFDVVADEALSRVKVDARRAHQALHNLLSYVAGAALQRSGTARVTIKCEDSQDRTRVLIKMSSPGAPLGVDSDVEYAVHRLFSQQPKGNPGWSMGLQTAAPEDAAIDESVQCLMIAKELLRDTGGTCALDNADDYWTLVVSLPSVRAGRGGYVI